MHAHDHPEAAGTLSLTVHTSPISYSAALGYATGTVWAGQDVLFSTRYSPASFLLCAPFSAAFRLFRSFAGLHNLALRICDIHNVYSNCTDTAPFVHNMGSGSTS